MSAVGRALDAAPRYLQLLRSQYWRPDQLRAYTERQLARSLAAAARIPFYQRHWRGSLKPEDFAGLPILERTDISALNRSVRAMYPARHPFLWGASSGVTAIEAEFLFDRSRVRGRYAARIRFLRAHGWNPLRRTIFHQVSHRTDSDWVNHRILPGMTAVSRDLAGQFERMVELDPFYLYMYPSNLEALLLFLEDRSLQLPSLRLVFTVGETVDDALRERVRRTLGVEIADNYGATEGFIAWQCPQGSYHINAEHVLVEIVDAAGRQIAPGETGRVLITTLENYLMPLVRYDLCDYAIASEGACRCGRTLPLIGRIAGRKRILFRAADGRLYFPYILTDTLRLTPEIKQYQVVQLSAAAFRIAYVAAGVLNSETQSRIREGFEAALGTPVEIRFERVPEFARTRSGKFLKAISEFTTENASDRESETEYRMH